MQQLTAFAGLGLATYGLSLGGAIADHGSPAETEQATLAEKYGLMPAGYSFRHLDPYWEDKFMASSREWAHCNNNKVIFGKPR